MATTSNGLFVWYEDLSKDPQAAIAFYAEVIRWKTQPFGEGGDYIMWVGSQGPLGGMMKLPDEAARMGAPPHWIGYVQVEDVDAKAALAKKLGAKVYKEPTDNPTVGRFAVLADPQGAAIAIFKPSSAMTLQRRRAATRRDDDHAEGSADSSHVDVDLLRGDERSRCRARAREEQGREGHERSDGSARRWPHRAAHRPTRCGLRAASAAEGTGTECDL